LVLQHGVGFYILVVFLFDFFLSFLFLVVLLMWFGKTEINQTKQQAAPKKGRLRRSRRQFIAT
jgi:ABC-type protease/lipase transport system fused ATPase/permease subunit